MTSNRRIAILISGRGSNMTALMDAVESGQLNATIAMVISNRADATGIQIANLRGYQSLIISSKGLSRQEHENLLIEEIKKQEVELVCLAGYMRILSQEFVRAFPQQILNIHPSLLPSFPGLDAQQQALDYGVKYSGCTVHFVDEGCDSGAIIAQTVVPIIDNDDVHSLSERILIEEHKIYAKSVQFILDKKWEMVGRRVTKKLDS